jgi:16S rRNA (cytosine1402-N4)-methyltransferase
MSEQAPAHKRRVRYKGKNPRRFEERYKEHDPDRYAKDVEHIVAKGNTPAGSHRPICVAEILDLLDPKPGQVFFDGTLGYGGHAQELLGRLSPGGKLLAVDVDTIELPKTIARLRSRGFGEDVFIAQQRNFAAIRSLLHEAGGGFDGILADLGVSSMQLDDPGRGFSYKTEGPLDLRLDPKRGKPACEMLRWLSQEKLEELLASHADEPYAPEIARAIKASAEALHSTTDLARIVREALLRIRPRPQESQLKRSLQRTFMAIRIAVNEELSVLDRFLQALPSCLKPAGRVAILSFHSGEDRRVKKAFALGLQEGLYQSIAPSPILPSAEERRSNPRASCAKLRWAVRSDLELGHR